MTITIAIAIFIHLWAGFTVWIMAWKQEPEIRHPIDLIGCLIFWWIYPVKALFE